MAESLKTAADTHAARRRRVAEYLGLERNVALASAAVFLLGFGEELWKKFLPKYLERPGAGVGIVGLFGTAGGWPLVKNSLIGMAVCAVPMVLAALPGWIGAGDAKLIAVCGAAAGFPAAVTVLFFVTIAGGVQAILSLVVARMRGSAPPRHVPYACSIAAGTLVAFLAPVSLP